jgi:predicted HAD superfamily Cof-like phosphohydrolase
VAAQARAARLAERRGREETHFAAAASALSTISKAVGNLELAVELANEKIRTAGTELVEAVSALTDLGYKIGDVAKVLGVDVADLRPGLSLVLRRARQRRRTAPAEGTSADEHSEVPESTE